MSLRFHAALALAILLTSTAAVAETEQERQACESDAFRVCGQEIPDRHNVFVCLMSNKSSLSAPCRRVMARYPQPRSREAGHSPETTGSGD